MLSGDFSWRAQRIQAAIPALQLHRNAGGSGERRGDRLATSASGIASPRVTTVRSRAMAAAWHAATSATATSNVRAGMDRVFALLMCGGRYNPPRGSATRRLAAERLSALSAENRTDGEISLGGCDLLAAVPAHPLHLDEAALAMDQRAGIGDRHHLAELLALHLGKGAGDALAALEQEQLSPVMRGPGARRRVDAADQVVGQIDMARPS